MSLLMFTWKKNFVWEKELQLSEKINMSLILSYLPTPPLGQDMMQGQFLSGV